MESGVRNPDSGLRLPCFIFALCYPNTCSIMSERAPFHWGRFPGYSISSISFLSFSFFVLFFSVFFPLPSIGLHYILSFWLFTIQKKQRNLFIYLFFLSSINWEKKIETYENGRWLLRFDDVIVLQLKLWRANYKQFFLRNIFQRLRRHWQ